jgi:hypothetical protein
MAFEGGWLHGARAQKIRMRCRAIGEPPYASQNRPVFWLSEKAGQSGPMDILAQVDILAQLNVSACAKIERAICSGVCQYLLMGLRIPKALKQDNPDVTLRRDVRESFVTTNE